MEGHELVDALMSMALGVFGIGLIVCRIGWRKATERIRELERQVEAGDASPGAVDGARVSEQLDALAANVERLGEGQEFLARVIADRERLPPVK
jgi:hypothetical protein